MRMVSERCHAAVLALHHGHEAQRLDACKRATSSISTPQNISAGSSVDGGHGSDGGGIQGWVGRTSTLFDPMFERAW